MVKIEYWMNLISGNFYVFCRTDFFLGKRMNPNLKLEYGNGGGDDED